jgi:hypothetical protein
MSKSTLAPTEEGPSLLCLGNDPELLKAMEAISSPEWGLDGQNTSHQAHHQNVLRRSTKRKRLFNASES